MQPTKNVWAWLQVHLAGAIGRTWPTPGRVRLPETAVAQPKIQERSPKLFRRIPRPLWIDPWPPAYSPNRAMPARFENRAEAPGETRFRLPAISRRADRFGPAMYASRTTAVQWRGPSGTPAKRLPNGPAEIRDHRESDAPKPNRDTDARPYRPNAQPGPGIRSPV